MLKLVIRSILNNVNKFDHWTTVYVIYRRCRVPSVFKSKISMFHWTTKNTTRHMQYFMVYFVAHTTCNHRVFRFRRTLVFWYIINTLVSNATRVVLVLFLMLRHLNVQKQRQWWGLRKILQHNNLEFSAFQRKTNHSELWWWGLWCPDSA